jgi:hypothetical protein
VDQRLAEAYLAVRGVSESHGETGRLVELLNAALAEMESGADPDIVVAHLDAVITLAEEERAQSITSRDYLLLATGAQVVVIGALVYATWRYFPRVFWGRWLRVRSGWLVEHADR